MRDKERLEFIELYSQRIADADLGRWRKSAILLAPALTFLIALAAIVVFIALADIDETEAYIGAALVSAAIPTVAISLVAAECYRQWARQKEIAGQRIARELACWRSRKRSHRRPMDQSDPVQRRL